MWNRFQEERVEVWRLIGGCYNGIGEMIVVGIKETVVVVVKVIRF